MAAGTPGADKRTGAVRARRKTKIVATLGPASRDERTIKLMLKAGMDVARINLSHGSTAEHADVDRHGAPRRGASGARRWPS